MTTELDKTNWVCLASALTSEPPYPTCEYCGYVGNDVILYEKKGIAFRTRVICADLLACKKRIEDKFNKDVKTEPATDYTKITTRLDTFMTYATLHEWLLVGSTQDTINTFYYFVTPMGIKVTACTDKDGKVHLR